jgi:MarR family transcriptional regulator, temperature-dependent positive regulator of motility
MADDFKAGLLVHLLHRASQRADGLFAREVGELGLTPRQFAVLQAVSAANGPSQTDIMIATGIDRSSIADLVRRLVTNGCLKRRRSKRDSRVYAVRLTSKGQQLLRAAEPGAIASDRALLSRIPEGQRVSIIQVIKKMIVA